MKKGIFFKGLLVLLLAGCKKEHTETPDMASIVYKALDTVVAYQKHITLKIDNDSTTDISLGSALLMQNNQPHLYLYAQGTSKNFNKILAKQGTPQPLGGYLAYPLQAGEAIGETAGYNQLWCRAPDKAVLADIVDTGDDILFNGLWIGLQTRYLGIQMNINDKRYYGWICISHQPGEQALKIHDLAYNTLPEQSIKAGQR